MLNKIKVTVFALILSLVFFACKEEELGGGELINYPNFEEILQNEWDMEEPIVYWKVTRTESTVDSARVGSSEMPWDEIIDLFKKSNIHKEELNHHYGIEIMNDSLANANTIYYKSLSPKDYTKSISIVSDGEDGKISNLYFETKEKGESGNKKKVLFIPKKLLQIQYRNEGSTKVETYFFPE